MLLPGSYIQNKLYGDTIYNVSFTLGEKLYGDIIYNVSFTLGWTSGLLEQPWFNIVRIEYIEKINIYTFINK